MVDKASQTVRAYMEPYDECGFVLTGTVEKATRRKVKASNLDGSPRIHGCSYETMHIDTLKWKRRLGTGTIVLSFEGEGTHRGPLTESVTCS